MLLLRPQGQIWTSRHFLCARAHTELIMSVRSGWPSDIPVRCGCGHCLPFRDEPTEPQEGQVASPRSHCGQAGRVKGPWQSPDMREVKRQREPSGPQWNKQHFWAPGTTQTISFCLVQKKGSVKEKNKTIKSICRGNVNTACWVAVHLVGKMHLSLGGITGSVSFRSCLGAGRSPWTQGCTGAGPLPGLCGWWSSLCSWLSAITASPTSPCPSVLLPAPQGHSEISGGR